MPICSVKPVVDLSMRDLCRTPYGQDKNGRCTHPKGCPNYGHRDICPPNAPIFSDVFNMRKPFFAVWVIFSLAAHRRKMRLKHPDWRRCRLDCCLYWQGGVNKRLHTEVNKNLIKKYKARRVTYCPEAMGINVTQTMALAGINLQWPPKTKVIKVAIIGTKNRKEIL